MQRAVHSFSMKIFGIILCFFFVSCSLFKTSNHLSSNLKENIHKVCLNSSGKGRLVVEGQKYIFSYESALKEMEQKWLMSFNFPLYGEEYIELEWSNDQKIKHYFSFEGRILKEQRGISPGELEVFFETWAQFLYEVIKMKEDKASELSFKWAVKKKELVAQKDLKKQQTQISIHFKNLVDDQYFGRYDIIMRHKNGRMPFKIEAIVRKCLEKAL